MPDTQQTLKALEERYRSAMAIMADRARFAAEHPDVFAALGNMTPGEFGRAKAAEMQEKAQQAVHRSRATATTEATERDVREEDLAVKALWSGVHIYIGHDTMLRIEGGAIGVEGLGGLIAVGLKGSADAFAIALVNMFGPISAAIAAGIVLKAAEFLAADLMSAEQGVWLPITWPQFPALTLPGLAAVYIHPLPADAPLNPWGLGNHYAEKY